MTAQQLEDRCGEFVVLKTNNNLKAIQILNEMGIDEFETENNTIKITTSNINNEEIVDRLVKSGVRVSEIFFNRLTLEEYYLNVTGGNNNG